MNVNGVTQTTYKDPTSYSSPTKKETTDSKSTKENEAAVYEKSTDQKTDSSKTIYNGTDKSSLINKMKKDAEDRVNNLKNLVSKMLSKQGEKASDADIWQKLRTGQVSVDEDTRLAAQKSLEGDGEYSVNTVSNNILSFAKALTGGDPEKAEEMRAAFQKGFDQATKAWGDKLPQISQDTYDAVMKGFDDWVGKTS